jgi:hypothetical protein
MQSKKTLICRKIPRIIREVLCLFLGVQTCGQTPWATGIPAGFFHAPFFLNPPGLFSTGILKKDETGILTAESSTGKKIYLIA